jgi:arginyl-tRNA--protein-N-Asp/Glu arginylyltransferase
MMPEPPIPATPKHSLWPAVPPPFPVRLTVLPPHLCAYLPRWATVRGVFTPWMDGDIYQRFMERGFRRSGPLVYQPVCQGCRACVSLRVPVARFQPSRSQRRCQRRNADLVPSFLHEARPDEQKFELYRQYQRVRHSSDDDRLAFEHLYEQNVPGLEIEFRDGRGRLVAVSICDLTPQALSSVYFYFDPAESARSLGTYSILFEIAWAREAGLPWYYLGYWVEGSPRMAYKRNFRPHELLGTDGVWRRAER